MGKHVRAGGGTQGVLGVAQHIPLAGRRWVGGREWMRVDNGSGTSAGIRVGVTATSKCFWEGHSSAPGGERCTGQDWRE